MSDDHSFQINMMEGISKFQNANARAFWQEMLSHLRGKPVELLSFEDIRARLRLREESYRGLHDVPLEQIVGSVGRYREFTRNFLPKRRKMQDRWSRVYAQAHSMAGLPPIELYKVGEVYFVRDGNHRVSVARQMGSKTIQAHVTELPTSVHLNPAMSADELDDAAAYAAFLEESGIAKSRPLHQPLELSERTRYADLLGHIYMQKALYEHTHHTACPIETAAADWYDHVYRPAVTLIRKYNMLEVIGARTEADLYLWLVDHLREVREQFGEEAPSRKISHAMMDFLRQRNVPIPLELKGEKDESMILSRTQIMRAVEEYRNGAADEDHEVHEDHEE